MTNETFPRPRIVVSECLGFAAVRYDGSILHNKLVRALQAHVDFIPVCPEVAIGLGVPRPTIRLVKRGDEVRLIQPKTGEDLTERMVAFGESFLSHVGPVDGFVLKNRSPSCALKDALVYPRVEKCAAIGRQAGIFATLFLRLFPDYPAEDEGRLTNRYICEHFLTAVFALARLREVRETGHLSELIAFHTRYKFVLMAYNQSALKALGRIVANSQKRPFAEVIRAYEVQFRRAFRCLPRRPSVVNVLMHALGYFSKKLSPAEKAQFLDILHDFREGLIPLSALTALLESWIHRFDETYLREQALFRPFPKDLRLPVP